MLSIWAVSNGYLDDLPVEKVQDFERKFLDFMRSRYSQIGETIRDSGKLEDDTIEKLKSATDEFKQSYLDSEDVETVETVAAEEGVPETSESPAAEGGRMPRLNQGPTRTPPSSRTPREPTGRWPSSFERSSAGSRASSRRRRSRARWSSSPRHVWSRLSNESRPRVLMPRRCAAS